MLCFVMSPARSVLLDLDGTLIDSQPGILSSCRAALRALGHEPDPSLDLAGIIGPPIEDIMRLLLKPYRDDRVAEAVGAYRSDYGERGLFGSEPYPGIARALADLRQAGAGLIVATSKRTRFATRILEHLDLAELFDAIHGSDDSGALDHKPELIAYVVDRHSLAPCRCIMVGDRRYDVAGAHANGMRALGVLWGYGTRDELEAAGADDLVGEPADLAAAALALASSAAR
jgi:phosphoglycolate phosphatase